MRLTANVRAITVPETNPMHPGSTQIYVVGLGQVATIDTGDNEDRYRWMVRGYLAAMEHAEVGLAVLTHHHPDHSSNLRWFQEELACDCLIPTQSMGLLGERVSGLRTKALTDGDAVNVSGTTKLRVIATPGHSADSFCYYLEDEGVLFTGDTVLGGSSTTVEDLGAYLQTLETLRSLPNLQMICPGHGPIVNDPLAYLDGYIEHRLSRERQIVAALSTTDGLHLAEIASKVYAGLDERLLAAATSNVRTHLDKLIAEGRVRFDSAGDAFILNT